MLAKGNGYLEKADSGLEALFLLAGKALQLCTRSWMREDGEEWGRSRTEQGRAGQVTCFHRATASRDARRRGLKRQQNAQTMDCPAGQQGV